MHHSTSTLSSQADAAVTIGGMVAGRTSNPGGVGSPVVTISHPLEKQITEIEQRLESLKGKPADDLVHDLQIWAKGAEESASAAITAAHNAIIYAWATGTLFNLAKDNLGHGRFGPWRDSKASEVGISKRTAQIWMKLAERCWDVRALLTPGTTLTRAYCAAGVLPEPAQATPCVDDGVDDADKPPTPSATSSTEPVFRALTEVRKRLRHLDESGEILNDEDRDRLEGEKSACVTLFDKLLNPVVP